MALPSSVGRAIASRHLLRWWSSRRSAAHLEWSSARSALANSSSAYMSTRSNTRTPNLSGCVLPGQTRPGSHAANKRAKAGEQHPPTAVSSFVGAHLVRVALRQRDGRPRAQGAVSLAGSSRHDCSNGRPSSGLACCEAAPYRGCFAAQLKDPP